MKRVLLLVIIGTSNVIICWRRQWEEFHGRFLMMLLKMMNIVNLVVACLFLGNSRKMLPRKRDTAATGDSHGRIRIAGVVVVIVIPGKIE